MKNEYEEEGRMSDCESKRKRQGEREEEEERAAER